VELTEVVGAIRVPHQNITSTDVGDRIDIGAAKTTLRSFEDARAVRDRDLGGAVVRAVDNQDFRLDSDGGDPLLAPVNKAADGDLFVERGNDDR